ncbi:hypothetical protein [Neisseria meningitidis]|nr:hypothetical protein [Neisseria meningitidis]
MPSEVGGGGGLKPTLQPAIPAPQPTFPRHSRESGNPGSLSFSHF